MCGIGDDKARFLKSPLKGVVLKLTDKDRGSIKTNGMILARFSPSASTMTVTDLRRRISIVGQMASLQLKEARSGATC